ncbi:hypothetical protein ACFQVA_32275 [Actinomadura keratinilytica]
MLDQRNLAGIGNVFKSELCFLLRVTPWLPVGELPDPERLTTLAARLLEANRHRPRRTTTGRPDRPLYVYGRAGRPCLRCGTPSEPPSRATPPGNAPPTGARAASAALPPPRNASPLSHPSPGSSRPPRIRATIRRAAARARAACSSARDFGTQCTGRTLSPQPPATTAATPAAAPRSPGPPSSRPRTTARPPRRRVSTATREPS